MLFGIEISTIADYFSIISFALSVALIFISGHVSKKITNTFKKKDEVENFNNNKDRYKKQIKAQQNLILKDDKYDSSTATNILNILNWFELNKTLLTRKDKKEIKKIRLNIKRTKTQNNGIIIAENLSYFIARFDKEEIFYGK